jgi:hypothetical protein
MRMRALLIELHKQELATEAGKRTGSAVSARHNGSMHAAMRA